MKNINEINFEGKRVVIRVDFNVPLDDKFNITDDTRMRAAMPTIKKVLNDNGMVILMSHLGRPKNNPDPKFSLRPIVKHLEELVGRNVIFADDCQKAGEQVKTMKNGEVMLLENLRFYAEEEGKPRGIEKEEPGYDEAKKSIKASQKKFTETLASYGDYYINDAFGTAHRSHASTALIADFFDGDHKLYGMLMSQEVEAVDKVMKDIKRPFTAIMGGSKVSTKIEIIENLLTKVDNLILCGGMTYTFKKALGGTIGNSICELDKLNMALDILAKAKEKGVKLYLAIDAVVADKFSNDANYQVFDPMNIPDGWEGMDIGPKTRELFGEVIKNSKTILWNGPCGVFEFDTFSKGSEAVARAIGEATKKNGAFSLIGGGDSVACINKFNLVDEVSYVSTGGGALLEAIEGKELPGIAAIRK